MATVNIREKIYFGAHSLLAGSSLGEEYARIRREDELGTGLDSSRRLLAEILNYCLEHVPFYRQSVRLERPAAEMEPEELLAHFPVLTKDLIRENSELLRSDDLSRRRWVYNTSGGTTGEPLRLIQDRHFNDCQMAVQWLSYNWAGRELGQLAIHVWGSDRDIFYHTEKLDRRLLLKLTNDRFLNAYMMTPEKMKAYIEIINSTSPQLIMAYAQSIFELARFADKEGLPVKPQQAIMSSASKLYPFMREKIETVFQSPLFDRYGSREVGDIACQRSDCPEMHVFPWGNYIEIVDEQGQPVPPGTEGKILATNLNNYAMPLIRYEIGDSGVLAPGEQCICGWKGQVLQEITGRITDSFKKADGTIISGAFFSHLFFFKDWVQKFQAIQTDYDRIVFRIQRSETPYTPEDLEEIRQKTRVVMGEDCQIDFEFPDEIMPSPSGKLRYTISEVM